MSEERKKAERKLIQKRIVGSRVIPIAALGLLVLFKFQNCAPSSAQYGSAAATDGQVKVVDNWSNSSAPVSFISATQVVVSSAPAAGTTVVAPSTNVRGLCVGTDGDLITWAVTPVMNPSQVVASGQVTCAGGEFQLPVGALTFQSCNDRYEVRATSAKDSSQTALTLLEPDCSSGYTSASTE